ncbi:MAG: porin [Candidatus Omnitrophica bacterium]|nr:porin [Candidatus Omnitrophota bacterium]
MKMKVFLIVGWITIGVLILTSLGLAAESDVDKLLDLLVEKGVLTKDDAAGFRADLAVKKQEEKEKQKEFNVVAGKPIKVSGYTQLRYRQDHTLNNDGFDIRRARLDIKGDVTERFDYRTQVEFGGTSGPFLLDATIGYKVNPYIKLLAGQFKVPFSQENLTSSPKLETINRSQVVEALVARGQDVIGNQNGRDIGIQVSGSIFSKMDYALLDYAAGVFNGSGINASDKNERKDFAGRLVFHPFKEWSVGGSYYNGYGSWGTPLRKNDRDRIGAEFAYVKDPLSLKGEYIRGNDGSLNREGWYLQGAYFIIPKKFQGVLKFDTYDSNVDVGENEVNVYTLGGNWYFNKWAFFQLDYELKDETSIKEVDNNALTGQVTLQF